MTASEKCKKTEERTTRHPSLWHNFCLKISTCMDEDIRSKFQFIYFKQTKSTGKLINVNCESDNTKIYFTMVNAENVRLVSAVQTYIHQLRNIKLTVMLITGTMFTVLR